MIVKFEGRDWTFDEDEITVKQATVLYLTYKMTLADWIDGLGRADQRSLHFCYWLMLQQNGVVKPIADADCKIIAFASAFAEGRAEEAAAAAAAAEPDPTVPNPIPGGQASPEPSTLTTSTPPPPGQPPEATVS